MLLLVPTDFSREAHQHVLNEIQAASAALPHQLQIFWEAEYRVKGNYSATMERISKFDAVVYVRAPPPPSLLSVTYGGCGA
jgi:hypothetical protein